MVDRGVEFVCIRTILIICTYLCICKWDEKSQEEGRKERSAFRPKLSLNDDAIVNYNQEEIIYISHNSPDSILKKLWMILMIINNSLSYIAHDTKFIHTMCKEEKNPQPIWEKSKSVLLPIWKSLSIKLSPDLTRLLRARETLKP